MPTVGTTHHISLGGHYYLVKPGTYQKRVAPQFGARFTTGDPDFNNLSFWQHWAQRCWVGGADAPEYGDDAMYDDGIGIDTTEHEKATLARGLVKGTGSNWDISAGTAPATLGWKFIVYNSKLYALTIPGTATTESRLWRYDASTDGWTRITALDTRNICARSVTVYDGKLFIGGVSTTDGSTPRVVYDDGALTSWSTLTNPSGSIGIVQAMMPFQQKLYVAFGTKVWRYKGDQTLDGNTVFYNVTAASSSNSIIAMEVHLGFLYMLSFNGHVHRTDGNTTFDIWAWDGQTQGVSIRSFDGRLFILTYEYTETTAVGWGCLYQMSGSAVTQLKRWGDPSQATKIGNLRVFDRRMFYGATNGLGMTNRPVFGVACYDPIEDAHSIVASNADATTYARGASPYENWIVDDQIFFGGQLFMTVRGHGAFRTPYQNNDRVTGARRYDISSAGASLASTNGGWFTTSTYDAGTPGLLKLWRKIVVDCALPSTATGIVVDYSTDNGTSWTTAGTISTASSENRARHEFALDNVTSVSLKLRFTLRSTDNTKTPVLYGYVVSYLPIPEPQWLWQMTVVLSAKQELLDGTTETVDTESELAFLDTTYRTKVMVNFVDVDGTSWAGTGADGVLIYDMTTWLPDLTQPLEGEVTLVLMEAVETY